MGKIKLKLIKYFIIIMTSIISVCFIVCSLFLSKIYITMKYNYLKDEAKDIYVQLKSKNAYSNIQIDSDISSAILYKNDAPIVLTQSKMGIMPLLRTVDLSNLKKSGTVSAVKNDFLYYKYHTDLGDIIVLQDNKFSSDYIHVILIVLIVVFIIAILLSIILISYFSRKFTEPILKLQRATYEIAQENFNVDFEVHTKDELEELSNSLKIMTSSLERKNALQRDFIANVSHDFKTPLSIIRNYSEAIYDDIIDKEQVKAFSQEIIRETDRLNNLVMELIELSKLQGKAYQIKREYFNLQEFLLSFKDTFSMMCSNRNIKLQVDTVSAEINADSKQLYRVLYNFIDNAFKFSKDFSDIKISAVSEKEGIRVSVKDNGAGIEKDKLEDVWNRYYKSEKSGGIGLGLAICSEILKLHEFEYGVTSVPNVETEFYFIIPPKDISS